MTTLTGIAAINAAEALDLSLSKYADPTEGAREGLTVEEAREIAKIDASLIWVEMAAPANKTEAIQTEAAACYAEAVHQGHDPHAAFELTEDDLRSIEQATGATRAEVLAVVA